MENMEETRFEVVKAMLEAFPELRQKVREYLLESGNAEEVEELAKLMKKQKYPEKAINNIRKIY